MKLLLVSLFLFIPAFNIFPQEQNMSAHNTPLTTVSHVDLTQYAGLWYETARIPNRFQKKCAYGVTALYELRDDGRIDVTNGCRNADGSLRESSGVARVVDTTSNARLQVSFVSIFGFNLFWGDYWIIGLAGDYSYAIVGTPSRKYGWILSRTTTLPEDTMEEINDILRRQGYDPSTFQPTRHKQ